MDEVQISTAENEAASWRERCYHRMETLKSREFPSIEDPASQAQPRLVQEQPFGEKNSVIFELQKTIKQSGNVDRFVDALEQLCCERKLVLSAIFEQVTRSGNSLLHVAAHFGRSRIAELIAHHFPELLTSTNNIGDTPLHLAARAWGSNVIEIVTKKPDLMYLRDEDGGTPLHYAAAWGYVEGVRILLNKSALTALEWNAKGHLPIHLACKSGHVEVVEEFLLKEELTHESEVLINKKGQNILHIAAKNGHYKRTYVNLKNNEGLTARDIIILQSDLVMTSRQALSNLPVITAGGRMSDKGKSMRQKHKKGVPKKVEWIKDRVNTLMLVAILIVTVTFAAGFTVPGSVYSSDDPNPHKRGMAVLGKRWMFQVFVLFNTISMYSSTFGSFLLLWAQLGDYHLALRSFVYALSMVGVALVTMTLAFMAAVRLVVSNEAWLATLITIIGIIFLSLISSIGILAVSPVECSLLLPPQMVDELSPVAVHSSSCNCHWNHLPLPDFKYRHFSIIPN
ncbi:protein ACCELERATED CELL DEATH 6 [Senna tora]|uniref:Protein ACCELERATED CELL DEATH 6 n=1 Tax=Senna tora TaxID=362788 RepID=A0A834X2J6_9FABA|nr:protein ACCELERATED CELL DEATH 6 [Senna tora]